MRREYKGDVTVTNQLPSSREVMHEDSSFNERFEASGELTEDFTDEELLKLYVLHFHEDDDRSTEEILRVSSELQQDLFSLAAAVDIPLPNNRHYVTFLLFTVIGPWSPSSE